MKQDDAVKPADDSVKPADDSVKVVIAKEYASQAPVAVAVADISSADDFTDDHGRVVVSKTPVAVPTKAAEALIENSPFVEAAE